MAGKVVTIPFCFSIFFMLLLLFIGLENNLFFI